MVFGAVYLLQYRGHSSGLEIEPFRFMEQMPVVALITDGLEADLPAFPGRGALLSASRTSCWVSSACSQRNSPGWCGFRAGWAATLMLGGRGCFATGRRTCRAGRPRRGRHRKSALFRVLRRGRRVPSLCGGVADRVAPAPDGRGSPTGVVALACLSLLTIAALMAARFDRLFSGVGGGCPCLHAEVRGSIRRARWAGRGCDQAARPVSVGRCSARMRSGADRRRPRHATRQPQAGHVERADCSHRGKANDAGALLGAHLDTRHSPADSVVAVNNAYPYEFNHAAFAEHRLFLGGWGSTRSAPARRATRKGPQQDQPVHRSPGAQHAGVCARRLSGAWKGDPRGGRALPDRRRGQRLPGQPACASPLRARRLRGPGRHRPRAEMSRSGQVAYAGRPRSLTCAGSPRGAAHAEPQVLPADARSTPAGRAGHPEAARP